MKQDYTKQNHLAKRKTHEKYYMVIAVNYVCGQFVSLSHHSNKYLDISMSLIIGKLRVKQEKLSNYRVSFHCPE